MFYACVDSERNTNYSVAAKFLHVSLSQVVESFIAVNLEEWHKVSLALLHLVFVRVGSVRHEAYCLAVLECVDLLAAYAPHVRQHVAVYKLLLREIWDLV